MDTDIHAGLLVLRIVVGVLLVAHGTGKLFGWFKAGFGVAGTAGYLEGFGSKAGRPLAVLVGLTEVGAGLLFAAGLATPLAAAGLIGVMLTAMRTDHAGKGPWIFNGGWEYVLTLATVAFTVTFTGPGRYALDHAAGWSLTGPRHALAALGLGTAASLLTLATRSHGTIREPVA